jgi:hypothetical protein
MSQDLLRLFRPLPECGLVTSTLLATLWEPVVVDTVELRDFCELGDALCTRQVDRCAHGVRDQQAALPCLQL